MPDEDARGYLDRHLHLHVQLEPGDVEEHIAGSGREHYKPMQARGRPGQGDCDSDSGWHIKDGPVNPVAV